MFAGPGVRIVYPDGSCLNCQLGASSNPAFEPDGTVISLIEGGRVGLEKIDGISAGSGPPGGASDAVWSASGRLAVVRRGTIWAGRPGRLRRIGVGSEPSWSSDGAMIAASRRGWIVIMNVRDRRSRRLVRGTAPAFSPDGRWIAYVASEHRLMIVRSAGARLARRRVGKIQAVSVDWQPKPKGSHPPCVAPPGSTVLASSSQAVVTGDGLALQRVVSGFAPPIAYMGCLRAVGRERLLESFTTNSVDSASSVGSAVLASPYAGLVENFLDAHYGGQSATLQVFDLRTGRLEPKLGGESVGCPDFDCSGPDQVVLGSDGVSAAHSQTVDPVGALSVELEHVSCAPATTTCVAVDQDDRGLSTTDPAGGPPAWTVDTFAPPLEGGLLTVDCPSSSLCVGSGGANIYTSTDPTAGASAWTPTPLASAASPNAMSCPSTNLCVIARLDGSIAASSDPTGGTGAWSTADIDGNRSLNAIFCSTQPECFTTDYSGTVLTSTDPTDGASAWTVSPTTPTFESGTCPTTSFCVAVNGPDIHTTTDPSAATWTTQSVTNYLRAIACPSANLCVAVGGAGALDVSTNPQTGPWTSATIDNGRQLQSIACPSASLCVAVDSTGHVVTSTNPTGGPSTWTPALIDGDPCTDTTPCSVEQIQASDATGLHTVDSSKLPGNGPFLTGLTLTGDSLSWNHNGTQQTVILKP
ncbi:MAG: hypothetical protein WAK93_12385 [Solirubrobacteraceae bacterium]